MPRFDLAAMVRRSRPGMRRRAIVLREIAPPAVMATDLWHTAYRPVVQAWERALQRIMVEYERSLSALTTDGLAGIGEITAQKPQKSATNARPGGQTITTDAAADLDRELGGVENELQRLLIELTPRLRDWALRTEGWIRGRWRGAVLSATGVDLQTFIGPEDVRETIEAFIARNVSLVRDVSEQARSRIADAVFRGLNQRKPAREVAAEIREAVAMGRRRALNIASHQMSSLSNELARERRREAGLTIFRWRHSGKLHARPHHKARDGQLFSESSSDVGKVVEGQTVRQAPPADDRAGVPPFCGCREMGVIVFD